MRIGIDARKIGPYVSYLLGSLPKYKNHKFVLFFDSRIPKKKAEKYKAKNVKIKYFPFFRYRKFIRYAYSQILVSAFIAKERLDIFHATAGTMPLVYNGKCVLNIWKIEKKKSSKALQRQIIRAAKKVIVPSSVMKKKLGDKNKIIIMSRKPKIKDLLALYKKVK